MNGFSLELPLTIIATLGAALAVTSARRGAWIALIIATSWTFYAYLKKKVPLAPLESLTAEVEKKAWELIAKIDAMGGSVAAIESGFMQDEIAKSAYAYQKDIESGEKIIVGVNKFTIDEAPTNIAFKIDDSIRQVQIEKINTLKQNRDNTKVAACLDAITTAAKGTDNIMPLVVEAVENKATLGEISNALRLVFGEF